MSFAPPTAPQQNNCLRHHDLDEALRLADRVAVMKDGAVEQCGTLGQIVLNPTTEYVRKFTEDINKSRVAHAGVLAKADILVRASLLLRKPRSKTLRIC